MTALASRAMDQSNYQAREAQERSTTRLSCTYIAQIDALKKYRFKAHQTVRVERVTVNEGGQAIVGDVTHGGEGERKVTLTPKTLPNASNTRPDVLPVPSGQGRVAKRLLGRGMLPRSRCRWWRATRPRPSKLSPRVTDEGDANRKANDFYFLQRCQRCVTEVALAAEVRFIKHPSPNVGPSFANADGDRKRFCRWPSSACEVWHKSRHEERVG